jgi:hypothetical protein
MSCGVALDEGRLADAAATPAAEGQPQITYTPPEALRYSTTPGWRPTDAPLGGGFLASLSRAWVFLRESMAMAFRDKDLIVPSLLAILVNALAVGGIVAALWVTGLFQVMDTERETGSQKVIITVAGAVATFLSFLTTYFFMGMTVNMVDVHLTGRDATLGKAFADARKNFMAIMWLAVVATAIAMVTSSMRSRNRRGLEDLVADGVDKMWQVATYLMLPIIILEDVPLREASRRAWRLHSRGAIGVVVGEIGVSILTGAIGFIGFLVAAGAAVGLYMVSPALLPVWIGGAVLLFATVIAFTMYVRTAYYTCLYLWAAATETVGAAVPAPAPLVAAMAA